MSCVYVYVYECAKEIEICMHTKHPSISPSPTHSSQSTATSRLMSCVGRPTAVRISSMVTRPALGILAAPTLASVAVRLQTRTWCITH